MTDHPRLPEAGDDPGMRDDPDPDLESGFGIPRWVKVVAIVVAVLALLAVVMLLIGCGGHGPSRHLP